MIHHHRRKISDALKTNFVPKSNTIEGQTFPSFSVNYKLFILLHGGAAGQSKKG
jgi:hypothetical protein